LRATRFASLYDGGIGHNLMAGVITYHSADGKC